MKKHPAGKKVPTSKYDKQLGLQLACIWCVGREVGVWATLFFPLKKKRYNQCHLLYLLVVLMLQLISGCNFKTKAIWKNNSPLSQQPLGLKLLGFHWYWWRLCSNQVEVSPLTALVTEDSLEGLGHTKCSPNKLYKSHLYLETISIYIYSPYYKIQ